MGLNSSMKPSVYKDVVALVPVAYSYNRVILNDAGDPEDYEILDTNPAFGSLTGLMETDMPLKKVSRLLPDTVFSTRSWIEFCGRLALEGKGKQSDKPVTMNGVNYHAVVFSPEINYFVALFTEIPIRKTDGKKTPESIDQMPAQKGATGRLRELYHYQVMKGEKERQEIASVIHSEIGQSMTVMMIELGYLAEHLAEDPGVSSKKIASLLEINNKTIKKMQEISGGLRPGVLKDLGLASAIEWYCREWERSTGVNCRLSLADCDVSKEKGLAFFRILQEALENVKSHSGASVVRIDLTCTDTLIRMTIHDNGKGISDDVWKSSKAMGLMSVRERAAMMGGSAQISGERGCKVAVEIPPG